MKPVVLICNPRKGNINPNNPLDQKVYQSMAQASMGDCITSWGEPRKAEGSPMCAMSSVLNFNFNCCWSAALNMRRKYRIDYFAMIHADVTAQPGWLDICVNELQRTGADRINVLMSYKDERELSQVALGRQELPREKAMPKQWVPRRLTLEECSKFPKTFSAKDTDMPERVLMTDNGLWVCDFTRWWASAMKEDGSTRFHFSQADAIYLEPDGNFKAEVFGEDYKLSYLLHDLGCESLVTRKVRCWHHDPDSGKAYPNTPSGGAKRWLRDADFFGDAKEKLVIS